MIYNDKLTVFFFFVSDFAGARVGSVGRLSGRRDIDAQSSKLSILRKVQYL